MAKSIDQATRGCTTAIVAELEALVARGEHTDSDALRDRANALDGVRAARALLAEEDLLKAKTPTQWREAMRVLRLAESVAGVQGGPGFSAGFRRVRVEVARLLEATS